MDSNWKLAILIYLWVIYNIAVVVNGLYQNVAGVSDEELRAQMYEDIDRVFIFSNEDIKIQWKFADLFAADGNAVVFFELQ